MPRPSEEILKRFQLKNLLTPLQETCESMTEENRNATKDSIIDILNGLPDFYNDVASTMRQRAENIPNIQLARASAQCLGTLKAFLDEIDRDFRTLPANPPGDAEQTTSNDLGRIITDLGLQIAETISTPARSASYESLPEALHESVKSLLTAEYPGGIYRHQAAGIQAFLERKDVCLSTSTASGKSLVFSAAAADLLMREPNALVIAMYPARALVQDQLAKWRNLESTLGLQVGQIDGSVSINQRHQILNDSSIVLMTPDVVHAWLMRELRETQTRLQNLKLVVLDEAHVYTGIFGTNMAYLLRRLQAASAPHRIIAATATIGEPESFLKKLTGRDYFRLVGDEWNGAPSAGKTIHLVNLRANAHDRLAYQQALLSAIATQYTRKFIAFSDSRIGVEQIAGDLRQHGVMPYRSGYEDSCRREIQNALNNGSLRGVVSTSALEIGVDIHDIDLVIILNYPPSINAFRQRLGRAGRSKQKGECLILDTHGLVSGSDRGLAAYLAKPPEAAHLYLGNKALEFGNALCAFEELSQLGLAENLLDAEWSKNHFPSLPHTFHSFLANEKNPIFALPSELNNIKQDITIGSAPPQLKIPLRGIYGTDFKLRVQVGNNVADLEPTALGYLTAAQRFREAYPGAIHRHLGIRYRVTRTIRGPDGWEIALRALHNFNAETSSTPTKFILPIYTEKRVLKSSADGFVTAAMVEVHERIDGFYENRVFKPYNADSPYFTRPLGHVRRSCGVIWFLGEDCANDIILPLLADALTSITGVSGREIGFGKITQKSCPLFENCGSAFVIYDDTPGNFFLTDDLVRYWPEIVERAKSIAISSEEPQLKAICEMLDKLRYRFLDLQDRNVNHIDGTMATAIESDENEWFLVIANGEKVFRRNDVDYVELVVTRSFMTRTGMRYEVDGIEGAFEEGKIVPASVETKMEWFNMIDRRPFEQGPSYFVLQDLIGFTPPENFVLNHKKIEYRMKTVPKLALDRVQVVRDSRIRGGIAFGRVEQTNDGWFRITSVDGSIASFQDHAEAHQVEWVAEVNPSSLSEDLQP